MSIVLEQVSKEFKGNILFDEINAEFKPGKIYGITGENGTGKTMLLRLITGLVKTDSGTVTIDGKIVRDDVRFAPDSAMIIENLQFDKYLTGYENMKQLAKIKNKISDQTINDWLMKLGLFSKKDMLVSKYSLGMNQRLALCQTLMEDEKYIFLDEPTNALDEDGVEQVRNLLKSERIAGKCILIISHNKEDIAELADEVYIIKNRGLIRV